MVTIRSIWAPNMSEISVRYIFHGYLLSTVRILSVYMYALPLFVSCPSALLSAQQNTVTLHLDQG